MIGRPAVLFLLLAAIPAFSQPETVANARASYVEIGGLLSTVDFQTPFWLQANRFGTVPRSGAAVTLRGASHKTWDLGRKDNITRWRLAHTPNPPPKWRASLGAEFVGNFAKSETSLLLPQAYGAISYGSFELAVGRRKQWVGLADSTLGTGSYAWSGNAMPIPKVQFGLTRFTDVPFTNHWLAIVATYSDGWFESGRAVTSELKLHQKQLYGRLGKPGNHLKLYGGFNHQVQWGGKSPYQTVDGRMPRGFKNYLYVITGTPSDKRLDSTITTDFDNDNRVGNHLGTIDLAVEFDGKNANWFLYRQSIYEDGSLYYLDNIADGLNGIRVRRKNYRPRAGFSLREVVIEGLYTKSQGGPEFDNSTARGRDNYFNNAQVRDGWSYFDRTIGTPFIPPTTDTEARHPRFGDSFTSNSRVWMAHLGMRGTLLNRIDWHTRLSYSGNAGVYDQPFENTAYQFSGLLGLEYPTSLLDGLVISGTLAVDCGDLYPNNIGGTLSFRKNLSRQAKPSSMR